VIFDPAILAEQLAKLEEIAGSPARYVVAFSGGLDSTVLLHALAELRERSAVPLLAIHIDHGLQAESMRWGELCAGFAKQLGVDFRSVVVSVALESGKGPEGAAREARYSALQVEMRSEDWLLSAHHREDQAETLLLNLIRGSGPAGIAGIGAIRLFGPGWLARPMLNIDRAAIKQYAVDANLDWIEDPSNSDRRFDRNFLRHEVLPRLASRWSDIATRLQRSSAHASEASALLIELAEIDLDGLGGRAERLPIDGLTQLSAARQRNLIRHALRRLDLSTPTTLQLDRVMSEVIPARDDAQPLVNWPGASVRRYRSGLYLLPEKLAAAMEYSDVSGSRAELGAGLGVLNFDSGAEVGLSEQLVMRGLSVRPRVGGEEFQPEGQSHTRKLKKLLQEEGVVPWMRDRLPLVYSGEQLVAVGDLWIAADAVARPGVAVRWSGRPALH
jgi:tRNA(Ile)-lysidine synthase